LAGENSVRELQVLHEFRAQRMEGRIAPMTKAETSDAHRSAMAWACEMSALEAAADVMADRQILWLDFDQFLPNPAEKLMEAARYFGFPLSDAEAERIATGPLMSRYSKDLDYDYSPMLRRELQDEARRIHGKEIESALNMLEEASQTSPLLARALHRAVGRQ
jgi:hypothetical protein